MRGFVIAILLCVNAINGWAKDAEKINLKIDNVKRDTTGNYFTINTLNQSKAVLNSCLKYIKFIQLLPSGNKCFDSKNGFLNGDTIFDFGQDTAIQIVFTNGYNLAQTQYFLKLHAAKMNAINIYFPNGSLQFSYQSNPNRAVNHTAIIFKRVNYKIDSISTAVSTNSFTKLEPGDYYVKIDILPNYNVATEIGFASATEIQIPQEGALLLKNIDTIKNIELYYEHGDLFEKFMTVNENDAKNKAQILLRPGKYYAKYKDSKIDFIIRANLITEINWEELKFSPKGFLLNEPSVFVPKNNTEKVYPGK
jgi:hypothetical protein